MTENKEQMIGNYSWPVPHSKTDFIKITLEGQMENPYQHNKGKTARFEDEYYFHRCNSNCPACAWEACAKVWGEKHFNDVKSGWDDCQKFKDAEIKRLTRERDTAIKELGLTAQKLGSSEAEIERLRAETKLWGDGLYKLRIGVRNALGRQRKYTNPCSEDEELFAFIDELGADIETLKAEYQKEFLMSKDPMTELPKHMDDATAANWANEQLSQALKRIEELDKPRLYWYGFFIDEQKKCEAQIADMEKRLNDAKSHSDQVVLKQDGADVYIEGYWQSDKIEFLNKQIADLQKQLDDKTTAAFEKVLKDDLVASLKARLESFDLRKLIPEGRYCRDCAGVLCFFILHFGNTSTCKILDCQELKESGLATLKHKDCPKPSIEE